MPVVAILNTNDDVVELLRIVVENAGFIAVSARVNAIKRGEIDFEQFVRSHQPAVIIYDIPPPYERQWAFLKHMRRLPLLEGVPFVLTTTNVTHLREIVGPDERIYEIVGKPYDLDQIVDAVRRAVAT
jgi:DNA-binding NtrC family response regulator